MVKINHRVERVKEKFKREQKRLKEKLRADRQRLEELRGEAKEKFKREAAEVEKEFRKNTATAIAAAFALVIALAWKDIITEAVNFLIAFTRVPQSQAFAFKLISAILLTFISVLGIIFVTKFIARKEGEAIAEGKVRRRKIKQAVEETQKAEKAEMASA